VLNSEGKPRNPLSFQPFFGGKRICLGKSFAEVTVRFTLSMLLFHIDFSFADPAEEKRGKQYFSIL
jgi:cytochrome P450